MWRVAVRKTTIFCFAAGLILALIFQADWQNSTLTKAQDVSNRAYYVATSGSDKNPGSLEKPFRTIQKCADVVKAGDTCYVREGTYRETVIPANSGTVNGQITFKPYENETVTISGTEVIGDWTNYEKSIYKTKLNWDLGLGNNQIFVDGQMMTEARWPNVGPNISQPVKAMTKTASYSNPSKESGSVVQATLTDPGLTQPANFWTGAKINIQNGAAYWVQTGTVTSSAPGQLNFDFLDWGAGYRPIANNPYFLWGKLAALDTASEWFLDSNSTLYVWTPKSDDPGDRVVEAKKRKNAFDLTNRSHITLERFNIFAATIAMDNGSTNNIIDGIDAKYVWHYTEVPNPDNSKIYETGINIKGYNNTLSNSRISYSAGSGISVGGVSQKIQNNVVSEVCYSGYEGAGIYIAGGTGHQVTQNTVYNSGRHTLMYNPLNNYDAPNYTSGIKIAYNNLYNSNLQTPDGGVIYTTGNGGGAEISYNLVHDNYARNLAFGNYKGAGIYLDNKSSNFLIHHNVIWNAYDASLINLIGINVLLYNNTFMGDHLSITSGYEPQNFQGSVANNNIFAKPLNTAPVIRGILQKNNLYDRTSPKFVSIKSNNYQIESTSPAVDAGEIIAPYTDGYVGSAPDIGAYEYGREPWKAGAESVFIR